MPSCVIRYCTSHSRKNKKRQGVTFHRFPHDDEERRDIWTKIVRKNRKEKTWTPNNHSIICSVHFKDEDKYSSASGRIFLKKHAVPSLMPHDDYRDSDDDDAAKPFATVESYIPVDGSKPSSETETPREIMLKRKLLKVTAAKEQLSIKYKQIQRQNRHLKQKCQSYESTIKELERELGIDK